MSDDPKTILRPAVNRALATIMGLRALNKQQENQINVLLARVDALETEMADLRAVIDAEVPEVDTGGSTGGVVG